MRGNYDWEFTSSGFKYRTIKESKRELRGNKSEGSDLDVELPFQLVLARFVSRYLPSYYSLYYLLWHEFDCVTCLCVSNV